MTPAEELAAALAGFHVTALPAGESVRAFLAGAGLPTVLTSPGVEDGQPVWSWQHDGKTGSHPRGDIPGAASTITRFLANNPP